mgnify:FL=1
MGKVKKENLAILGSTGSIGVNALKAAYNLKNRFSVKYISGYNNFELLAEQVKEYEPEFVIASDENYSKLKKLLSGIKTKILSGEEGLKQA